MYPTQPDYGVTAPSQEHRTMEMAMNKRPNWEHIQVQISKLPASYQNNQNKRIPTKSLAELQQRKLEVISQLEKVVGKRAASVISNTASNQAKHDSSSLDEGTPPYYFWTGNINSGPTFVRSDSILKAEDDYVPFEIQTSKYGPISRMSKENVTNSQSVQVSSTFGDNTISTPMVRRPVSAPSPITYPNLVALSSAHPVVTPYLRDANYIAVGMLDSSPNIPKMYDKDLLAESQRVKIQLRNLEKKINDLKLASQSVTLTERERLIQELQLIEQGIFEKQKEVQLVSTFLIFTLNSITFTLQS